MLLVKLNGLLLSRSESRDCCAGSPAPPEKCQATFVLGELSVPVSVHPIAVLFWSVSILTPSVVYILR